MLPKFRWSIAVGLVLITILLLSSQIELKLDPRPKGAFSDIEKLSERSDVNLIFILVDTLRADHLGAYGYSRETSPYLDYLASSGVRFENHYSQSSWTKSSMASLWTGLYPVHSGVRRAKDALPEVAQMPAEVFQEADFLTIGIWRNGWIAPNFGFSQGFDIYQTPLIGQMPDSVKPNVRAGRIAGTDIDLVYSASEFLRTHHDVRFFLYLHMMDVHQYVYDEGSELQGSSYMDSYDRSIRWIDRQIQSIVGEVERLGLRDRTVIVIASDHGEAFGEHGAEGHAKDVYAEVTQTPWIISFPFRLDGPTVESRTANVDIWPTLLDLFGLDALRKTDGRSQLAAITGADEQTSVPRFEFSDFDKNWSRLHQEPAPIIAVRAGDYRLIRRHNFPDETELYDLSKDKREQINLASSLPEIREQLSAELNRYQEQEVYFKGGADQVELGDMELRQLRALGYVVD